MPKRLYRSNSNRILGGVCGGIAEYFNVDPVIIRLIWIVFTVIYGFGILLYLIAWVIIPRSPEGYSPPQQGSGTTAFSLDRRGQKALVVFGLILVLIGVLEFTRLSEPIRALAATAFSFPFIFIWLGILVIVIALMSRR
ncbi:MAG: PspC domain-containing protein [Candidatus Verstraetearchaeota archaeon]|nr:PspC domain-containing protein [Candidatus Verstraetearchaeota archaeon]